MLFQQTTTVTVLHPSVLLQSAKAPVEQLQVWRLIVNVKVKFSQKVRNLKAHDTFERYGYAKYDEGIFTITDKGMNYLKTNMDKLKYLLVNDFNWEDLKNGLDEVQKSNVHNRKIEVFDETLMIQEGVKKLMEKSVYERSAKLREAAIKHFTKNWNLICI